MNKLEIILFFLLIAFVLIFYIYKFIKMSKEQRFNKVKEWLLYAVVQAQKGFGSGTGKIKLRYVYDKFLTKFPVISKMISFEKFSQLVDEALEKMKMLLESNNKIKEYIIG